MLNSFHDIIRTSTQNNRRIGLAVSGGADSMCMTLLFSQINFYELTVFIVDHRLRKESTEEAIWVKNYIQNNFKFDASILTVEKSIKKNIQSQARHARYGLMIKECEKLQIEYLCTAHNQNDLAETVLMNIMRGSGIDGLVGIKEKSYMNNVVILRPLLRYSHQEIRTYLQDYNIKWVEDSSNHNDKYERVKIRSVIKTIENSNLVNAHMLIPRLNMLSLNALRVSNFLNHYVKEKITEICKFWHMNVITFKAKDLLSEDDEVSLRIMRDLISECGQKQYSVRGESLYRLYENIKMSYNTKKSFDMTLGGCIIYSSKQHEDIVIVISQEKLYKHIDSNSQFVRKNEIKKLIKAIAYENSEYNVYDEKIYRLVKEMIANIPRVSKILLGIDYHEALINGKKELVFPSLGISKVLV